ncbi:MAG TPA: hypothetical protein VIR79_03455 [Nitrospira sp.]
MKKAKKKKILPIMVAALAVALIAAAPAMAKSSKNSKKSSARSSAAAAAASIGASAPAVPKAPKRGQHDSKPGPAWRTIDGTVKTIDKDTFLVEDYEGNEVKLYVGQGTKHIKKKKVGDTVRAEITRGGFANSIQ